MREELKTCPFCGGKAVIKAVNRNYGLTIWCQCTKCDARTEGYCPDTNNEYATIDNIENCFIRNQITPDGDGNSM